MNLVTIRQPLLIMSDAPSGTSGLGRITRELCQRIQADPETCARYEVGTLGFGAGPSRSLPWKQYKIERIENWTVLDLPDCWREFAGDEPGVLMTIWNPAWLPWLAEPSVLPEAGAQGEVKRFIESGLVGRWGYFPVDAENAARKLPGPLVRIIEGFDRRLFYTQWARDLYCETIDCDSRNDCWPQFLPHGIDTSVFFPHDRDKARAMFRDRILRIHDGGRIASDVLVVGVNATNTPRKDWALAFATLAELVARREKVVLLAHTNHLLGKWDLMELVRAAGVSNHVIFTTRSLSDEELSWWYAATDVTLAIGSGEGFGYPIAESLACGRPVVHGAYAGGAEILPEHMLAEPLGYYAEPPHGNLRPVFEPRSWATRVEMLAGSHAGLDARYHWNVLWPRWRKWLLEEVQP